MHDCARSFISVHAYNFVRESAHLTWHHRRWGATSTWLSWSWGFWALRACPRKGNQKKRDISVFFNSFRLLYVWYGVYRISLIKRWWLGRISPSGCMGARYARPRTLGLRSSRSKVWGRLYRLLDKSTYRPHFSHSTSESTWILESCRHIEHIFWNADVVKVGHVDILSINPPRWIKKGKILKL